MSIRNGYPHETAVSPALWEHMATRQQDPQSPAGPPVVERPARSVTAAGAFVTTVLLGGRMQRKPAPHAVQRAGLTPDCGHVAFRCRGTKSIPSDVGEDALLYPSLGAREEIHTASAGGRRQSHVDARPGAESADGGEARGLYAPTTSELRVWDGM
eukprot:CAMPEP_0174732700 /NCGR_PEP_ID=MMETSP1094-20130205/59888_1 /TAXON_ID=156173 /ORGANISM="Chrysochromulina brevifilum, Strain UTEX LB 985" /LENGTH=155 /DNA_ID=CAMNT_0015935249 /DNA_START=156 /DNA_END=622 /DNA_ORIENTATION=+